MKTYKDLGNFDNWLEIEKNQFSISVIKGLVMDATRQANSGHPGGPMSCADFAYVLYQDHLNFDPNNPNWFNRDRFILSGGHMSMLQYSLLLFIGWLEMDDIKNFRQFGSRTPGHPEVEIPADIESVANRKFAIIGYNSMATIPKRVIFATANTTSFFFA